VTACDTNSLICPRKAVDFQFAQLFSWYKEDSDFSQDLYMSELHMGEFKFGKQIGFFSKKH
jgi:MinD superfamily P-loop ATPase